ncbi:MAG: hypothetical protein ABIR16_03175 [Dokdonella sp.]
MTRDELKRSVPIRSGSYSQGDVVAMADIPMPWRQQFFIAMAGHSNPKHSADDGPCAFAEHWLRWVDGRLSIEPTDLDDQ